MSNYTTPSPIVGKGKHLLMSSGCYSDYYIMGLFIAKQDIDLDALLVEFEKDHPYVEIPDHWEKGPRWKRKDFIEFIINKDLLERIPYFEFYTGDYGTVTKKDVKIHGPAAMFLGNNAGIQTDYL